MSTCGKCQREPNLKAAVAKVLGFSRQRVETESWTVFRSHFDLHPPRTEAKSDISWSRPA
jgi:hypothetical protein